MGLASTSGQNSALPKRFKIVCINQRGMVDFRGLKITTFVSAKNDIMLTTKTHTVCTHTHEIMAGYCLLYICYCKLHV